MTEPFISQESIRSVLEGMLYNSNETESSLVYLTLVHDFLTHNRIPLAENRRLYAVRSIISALITDQLHQHRHNFGLQPASGSETLKQAQQAVQQDSQQQSAELIGWSLLYYRYVRVDLNLTPADLSDILHVDVRTLRRYQAKTIERLRDLLTYEEAQVRWQHKRLYLLNALPYGKPTGLIGRTELAGQVRSLLHSSPPAHLLLTGPSGIGKTSFMHLLLHQQIEADELDRIIWISSAKSVAYIQHHLQQVLDNPLPGIRAYLANHRVAIILDDIQELTEDIEALSNLILLNLTDAVLYVIHTLYVPLTPNFKHIVLPELTKDDVWEIIAASRSLWTDEEQLENFVEYVWNTAGGNPLVVKLAANGLNNRSLPQPVGVADARNQLAANMYANLKYDTKRILYITALCPPFDLSSIASIWPLSPLSPTSIVELAGGGWLQETDKNRYTISDWALRYIQVLYAEQPEVRNQIDRLVDELTHHLIEDANRCYQIAEYILFRSWPELSISRRQTWIELASDPGINQGNYAIWASLLKGQGDDRFSLDLSLKHAVCLRKLGELTEAQVILHKVIAYSGQKGEFIWQGRGNLELSITFRQQGLYERAAAAARQALAVFERFGDKILHRQAELEIAQIAYDAGNLDDAQAILKYYAPDNPRILSLIGEIHLAHNDLDAAQQCVAEAITLTGAESAAMGRLLAQMGRIHFVKGDLPLCESYLLRAMALLETHADQFGLGRTKTNLAAALLRMHRDYDDVRKLLLDAQRLQLAQQDRYGLMITQRNLAELDHQQLVGEA